MPYGEGSYTPSWVAAGILLGLVALGIMMFTVFMKLFPILDMPDGEQGANWCAGCL